MPSWIDLFWVNWKHRPEKDVGGAPYQIRLHRNYANSRFCPVAAILVHIFNLREAGATTGPLFQKRGGGNLSEATYNRTFTRAFNMSGLQLCSDHSNPTPTVSRARSGQHGVVPRSTRSRRSCGARAARTLCTPFRRARSSVLTLRAHTESTRSLACGHGK